MRMMIAAVAAASLVTAAASGGPWPEGKKAAVVLTYDDALTSQLDIVIPALDAAGLKGTFFLTGAGLKPETITRWRAAAAEGHELGNHTLFHPCNRGSYPMPPQYNTESYSEKTMLAEIGVMGTLLTAIDGKAAHAFAVPCGHHLAGGEDYVAPLRASGLVRYLRDIDPAVAPSVWLPETATGADLVAAVKDAERSGGLVVFGFHGVGGDYLTTSAAAHAELVAYLKAHSETLWVAPFSTVMDAVTRKKK